MMSINLTKQETSGAGDGGKRAVILLGHGSRAASAADDMEKVACGLRKKLSYDIIETCQMSGRGAHFPEVFERCIAQGAAVVLVLPYFLHRGIHLLEDVPAMMREKAANFPVIKVILGHNLGFDEAIVDILLKRVDEAENLCDIREMGIHDIENHATGKE